MDWLTILGAAGSAFLGSGVGGAAYTARAKRNEARRTRLGTKADNARDALTDLDAYYRGLKSAGRKQNRRELAENVLRAEIDKCADENLSRLTETLIDTGRLFAAGDLDQSEADYTAKVLALRAAIRTLVDPL